MESLQSLKSRLKAVNNISQITKAMEVVSATKMRRSQEIALRTRPYAWKVLEILERLSKFSSVENVLMAKREVKNTLLVVVASDKGLAGSFNSQVLRLTERFLLRDSYAGKVGHKFLFLPVGKKAIIYCLRKGFDIVEKFSGFGDFASPEETEPIADFMIKGYESGKWDRVVFVSTHFRTTLKQDVLLRQVLPLDVEKIKETIREIIPERGRYAELSSRPPVLEYQSSVDYIFEPTPAEAINFLMPHLLKIQVHELILEANASEHSARMVAMKNASSNASEIAGEITLLYNKARQAAITKELIEIVSTQGAM